MHTRLNTDHSNTRELAAFQTATVYNKPLRSYYILLNTKTFQFPKSQRNVIACETKFLSENKNFSYELSNEISCFYMTWNDKKLA